MGNAKELMDSATLKKVTNAEEALIGMNDHFTTVNDEANEDGIISPEEDAQLKRIEIKIQSVEQAIEKESDRVTSEHSVWESYEKDFNQISSKISDMRLWGFNDAIDVGGLADNCSSKIKDKLWKDATDSYVQLDTNFPPVLDSYESQILAEVDYDLLRPNIDQLFEYLSASEHLDDDMNKGLVQVKSDLTQIDKDVDALDYVLALETAQDTENTLIQVEMALGERLIELGDTGQYYEHLLAGIQPDIDAMSPQPFVGAFADLEKPIAKKIDKMQGMASMGVESDGYNIAIELAGELKDDFAALDTARAEFTKNEMAFDKKFDTLPEADWCIEHIIVPETEDVVPGSAHDTKVLDDLNKKVDEENAKIANLREQALTAKGEFRFDDGIKLIDDIHDVIKGADKLKADYYKKHGDTDEDGDGTTRVFIDEKCKAKGTEFRSLCNSAVLAIRVKLEAEDIEKAEQERREELLLDTTSLVVSWVATLCPVTKPFAEGFALGMSTVKLIKKGLDGGMGVKKYCNQLESNILAYADKTQSALEKAGKDIESNQPTIFVAVTEKLLANDKGGAFQILNTDYGLPKSDSSLKSDLIRDFEADLAKWKKKTGA